MREAHDLERAVGMAYYASDADGTGGRLRDDPADFRVREKERFDTHPVDADIGDYPHLVLRVTLRGWDTNEFARRLSNRLGMSCERVSWAGTKDKDAVTTQLFTLRGVAPGDLPDLDNADVAVVGRAGRSLQFGDLVGNEFEIVVRDPDHPENADAVTDDLREFGGGAGDSRASPARPDRGAPRLAVPNFFGQQRFGSYRPITHRAGLHVVRGEWEQAVLAYVAEPSAHEPDRTSEAREFVRESRDWSAALDRFPGHLRYERAMLHSLVETGGDTPRDFREALETLPSNLQRLLVNAAQSYVYNRVLSRRLERGLPFHEPVEGDVVCFADTDAGGGDTGVALPDTDRLQRATDSRLRVLARHCDRGRAFVTAPLVGTETEFADGEPGEIERAVLDDLDLAPGDFDRPGEFHSTGTRRAILVQTDVDAERGGEGDGGNGDDALTFTFALPKGSYATVVLREYLKVSPLEL
jgi:tRNA pseudouridine13 synthase